MSITTDRQEQAHAWAPTPLADLRATEIPTGSHFVRDHFPVPELDACTWTLCVGTDLELDLAQLRARPARTLRAVLECAGHRRNEFRPLPDGIPWGCGAIGEARWTGTSLAGLLHEAGVPAGTVEVVLEGADGGPVDGVEGDRSFARSLPLAKALDGDVLLAWEMNGEPIARERGGPVRAIVPGWYATDSVKWLTRVSFASAPFDGVFQAREYRFHPPGTDGPGERLSEVPVSSLITDPSPYGRLAPGDRALRGIAWGGCGGVAEVALSVDGGPWHAAWISPGETPYARAFWQLPWSFGPGLHTIVSRAVDAAGHRQPLHPPANEAGYANHAVHRVTVDVDG